MKKTIVLTLSIYFMVWSGSAIAAVIFADDFNSEHGGTGQGNYYDFANWTVSDGSVDLLGGTYYPQYTYEGLSVDLDGSTYNAGVMTSKEIGVETGCTYLFSFNISGNMRYGTDTVSVKVTNSDYNENFLLNYDEDWQQITRLVTITSGTTAQIIFDNAGGDNKGALLDNVSFSTTPVPIPPTVLLMGPGILGLLSLRFKKRRAHA